MPRTKTTHLILASIPAWGHIRPLLVLATKLLLERDDLVLTVILAPTMVDKAHSDLETHFEHEELAPHRERIRVVAPFNTQEHDMFKVMKENIAAYPAAYQTLLEEKPITCVKTGTTFEAVPAPTAIVMDFFALGQLRATREITGTSVPVIAWLSSTASSVIRLCGPQEYGGLGGSDAQIEAEAQRTGRPFEEIAEEIYRTANGSIINVAGIPPMYDHEFFPQLLPMKAPTAPLARSAHLFFKESDGTIITTSETYENPESMRAFREWLGSWGKSTFGLGPLLPIGYGKPTVSISSRGDTTVEAFLDKSLKKYGEKSVLFISFGTVFWPTNMEYIDELIEALIEKELPFLFCHASPFAKISKEIQKKVKASGLGLLTKWAPQQYVLTHPSVGWFLTHGGHGGITEALASGIPLIGWPFTGDQPLGIAQLETHHKVAIELVEVRTGEHGLKPIRRLGDRTPVGTREAVGREIREVIDHVRGEKGKEMAVNAARVKKEIAQLWEEDGVGKKELAAFLEKFVDAPRVAA
ncbi:UDP-Glycosyltransferase/glycogen phosphorylase [Pholiota conissans]|uniref:UDP-Glycosyltransferase/glycogen phosphorylase n=1 Tax=Pholiota conissans TaxID=109636 RepID=A0A9P5ZHN1_9AGAR|nr:UDP-Glycosyltransferase/glycogen phosphorylase [Pholiota conissans]